MDSTEIIKPSTNYENQVEHCKSQQKIVETAIDLHLVYYCEGQNITWKCIIHNVK